uniref:Uncharacterized protein n=1 Tax=Rhizophora mucronata TaxID=61149 RepID=A0A2P2QJX0_RHIMU
MSHYFSYLDSTSDHETSNFYASLRHKSL